MKFLHHRPQCAVHRAPLVQIGDHDDWQCDCGAVERRVGMYFGIAVGVIALITLYALSGCAAVLRASPPIW